MSLALNKSALEFLQTTLSKDDYWKFYSLLHADPTLPADSVLADVFPHMSARLFNCLKNTNIFTFADLGEYLKNTPYAKTDEALLRIPNFGKVRLEELKSMLGAAGWDLHKLKDLPNE